MKKLHLGTMSFGYDTMDEVVHQLNTAFGADGERSLLLHSCWLMRHKIRCNHPCKTHLIVDWRAVGHSWPPGYVCAGPRCGSQPRTLPQCTFLSRSLLRASHAHRYTYFQVTPVTNDDGSVTYQASSPDEVAIVKWTESVGVTLTFRDRGRMELRTPSGSTLAYDVLEIFPFTSESKRMGIVVRDTASGELSFLQKGADVVMARIVQRNDWLEEETANMAREGLRTLVVGRRKLSVAAYEDFKARYHAASVRLEGRNEAVEAVVSDTLERDLELLGLTGVEDKLQDDVRGTLELLRNAGIKIWMLTGDKIETATVIAISTKLVARNQYIHQVSKRELVFFFFCCDMMF